MSNGERYFYDTDWNRYRVFRSPLRFLLVTKVGMILVQLLNSFKLPIFKVWASGTILAMASHARNYSISFANKQTIMLLRYVMNIFQNPREASSRSRILLNSLVYLCMRVCVYLFMCVTSPGETKNDTDLKFGTHTPIDLI